jgi:hypothetical protein
MIAAARRPGGDDPKAEIDEVRDVRLRPGDELEVVRLILFRDPDLDEPVEAGPVLAAVGGCLDEPLDVREPQDRGEAGARDPPVRPLALPIRKPEGFKAADQGEIGRASCRERV